jgi:hypothetical protein
MDRATLKRAIVALLDTLASEHPQGHQRSKGRRYVLRSEFGADVALMFEQNEGSPPNLWVEERLGAPLKGCTATAPKRSSAAALFRSPGKYGRHSALQSMPELEAADLLCFAPRDLEEVGRLLDGLLGAKP